MESNNWKLKKALQLLDRKGLDGLIVYSNGTYNLLKPSYLLYFTGVKPLGSNNALIITRSGDVSLLVEPQWDSNRVSTKTWISDVRGSMDFMKDLIDTIREKQMIEHAGIVGANGMIEEFFSAIEREICITLVDDIVEEMAKEKTEEELGIVKKVAKIADKGFETFMQYVRIGIREYELAAEVEYSMRLAGADDNFILLSSGKHNHAMHPPSDRRLAEGDIVIGEITPAYKGQFVQLCRTVFLGTPTPLLTEKYEILVKALRESLKSIKPGMSASIISLTINKIISEYGYAKFCYPPYMRARGHGIGIGSLSPGAAIDDSTEVLLQSGQVVIVHPNQYLPETGYLACGETYLVTETGVEILSETKSKLYIKEI